MLRLGNGRERWSESGRCIDCHAALVRELTDTNRPVISDVASTTPVRERSTILRYDDWIFERAQNPDSWLLGGGDDDSDDEDDGLALACRFGGHTFALDGAQSIADIAADIALLPDDRLLALELLASAGAPAIGECVRASCRAQTQYGPRGLQPVQDHGPA